MKKLWKAINGWKTFLGVIAMAVVGIVESTQMADIVGHAVDVPEMIEYAIYAWTGVGMAHKVGKAAT